MQNKTNLAEALLDTENKTRLGLTLTTVVHAMVFLQVPLSTLLTLYSSSTNSLTSVKITPSLCRCYMLQIMNKMSIVILVRELCGPAGVVDGGGKREEKTPVVGFLSPSLPSPP